MVFEDGTARSQSFTPGQSVPRWQVALRQITFLIGHNHHNVVGFTIDDRASCLYIIGTHCRGVDKATGSARGQGRQPADHAGRLT